MILTLVSVRLEGDGNVKKKKKAVKGVIKGLKKASKLHAKQAKTLKGVLKNESRSSNRKIK